LGSQQNSTEETRETEKFLEIRRLIKEKKKGELKSLRGDKHKNRLLGLLEKKKNWENRGIGNARIRNLETIKGCAKQGHKICAAKKKQA